MNKITLLVVAFLWLYSTSNANIIYINKNATGFEDGTSWMNAYVSYDQAYADAVYGDTIVFSAGMYTASDDSRSGTFRLKEGVKVFGGFGGFEEINDETIAERNFLSNETILSGDVNGDDYTGSVITDNVYNVVTANATAEDITEATHMDGCTIIGGNANSYGVSAVPTSGGGIFIQATNGYTCSPYFSNLRIISNKAEDYGGGIYMYVYNGTSEAVFENCEISSNYAMGPGGGVYMKTSKGICAPQFLNCEVSFNDTGSGTPSEASGIYGLAKCDPSITAQLSPILNQVSFCNNLGANASLSLNTGDPYMSFYVGRIDATIHNCSFAGNVRDLYLTKTGLSSVFDVDLTNTILTGSSSPLIVSNVTPIISNSLITGSGGSGDDWNTYFGTDNGGNIDADPLFARPDDCDVRLLNGSPALLAGLQSVGNNIGSYQGEGLASAALIICNGFKWMFADTGVDEYSNEYAYDVSAMYLTSDLIINAPEGFQISTISDEYIGNADQIQLTPTNGVVEQTTIYVRFLPTEEKDYYGNITHTSTDALTKQIVVSGTGLVLPPSVSFPTDITFDDTEVDAVSTIKGYSVIGKRLSEDLTITVTGPFVINTDYMLMDQNLQTLTFSQVGGEVDEKVWFQFRPTEEGYSEGIITISSEDAETVTKTISATGIAPIPSVYFSNDISFDDTEINTNSLLKAYSVVGENLSGDVTVSVTGPFVINADNDLMDENIQSLTLQATAGEVNTQVWFQFRPIEEGYSEGIITISSEDAETVTKTISGIGVSPPPSVYFSNDISFDDTEINTNSLLKAYSVVGENLSGDVTVSVTGPFVINTDNDLMDENLHSLTLQATAGEVNTQVWFQFRPIEEGYSEGIITINSEDAETVTKTISGVGILSTGVYGNTEEKISISPNPASDVIKVNAPHPVLHIQLFNQAGVVVRSVSNSSVMNVSDLSRGVYIILVSTEKQVINKKVLMQ